MFFTSAGLLARPVLGLLDLSVGSEETKLIAEVTLTLVLFADASRISVRALRREYAVPLRLLGLGLPLTIAAGAAVGIAVLPGVSPIEALVLAVMLACTDAALGQRPGHADSLSAAGRAAVLSMPRRHSARTWPRAPSWSGRRRARYESDWTRADETRHIPGRNLHDVVSPRLAAYGLRALRSRPGDARP